VSKEAGAEEQFKEVSEAYETLKDPEKRAAYDELGTRPQGQEFRPPPDWERAFAGGHASFDDIDLADLFASFGGRRAGASRGAPRARRGTDYEATVRVTFDQAFHGTEIELDLSAPEYDEQGNLHREPHHIKVRIPRGVVDGQTLRVPGQGGKGVNGGSTGDLYLHIEVAPHPLFRVEGLDLHIDLPLAPWEAVLGTRVDLPTPGGTVSLKVPAGTRAGQKMRLAGRGMARPDDSKGDLYAHVQIQVPSVVDDRQRALYQQLADASAFDPRAHFKSGG